MIQENTLYQDIVNLKIEEQLSFFLYILSKIYNDKVINEKNKVIFNFRKIGISKRVAHNLIEQVGYIYNEYNEYKRKNRCICIDGNIIGIKYSKNVEHIIELFDDVDFNNKLKSIIQIIDIYDNKICFEDKIIRINSTFNITKCNMIEKINEI